jgi:sugar phosphate isomerase/epimerase
MKTLETAERLGAKLVVLHTGAIEMKDYTDRLLEMLEAGEKESRKYEKLCNEVVEKREAKKEKFMELATEMIRRMEPEAARRGLMLGIENREALEEIPFETDFQFFLQEFPGGTVRYWHDTGHGQIKHNLGFIDHAMHLENMSESLAGFHLHDVRFPGMDHCPPGSGMIDFPALKPFVRPEHIKVFEMNPGISPEDVKTGVAHLKSIWGEE